MVFLVDVALLDFYYLLHIIKFVKYFFAFSRDKTEIDNTSIIFITF